MADDVDIPVVSTATIATDEVAGRHFQLVKLTDSTDGSTDPTGVADNPLTVDARVAFVDWDNSIVAVTDNDDAHYLPVAVRNGVSVTLNQSNVAVSVDSWAGTFDLTGPSDGVWGTDLSIFPRVGCVAVHVLSVGGSPTIAVYGAATQSGSGGIYDQQLPLVVPSAGGLVVASTFSPGVGFRFFYLPCLAPYIEIRAESGGTSDPVSAVATTMSLPPTFTMVAT